MLLEITFILIELHSHNVNIRLLFLRNKCFQKQAFFQYLKVCLASRSFQQVHKCTRHPYRPTDPIEACCQSNS